MTVMMSARLLSQRAFMVPGQDNVPDRQQSANGLFLTILSQGKSMFPNFSLRFPQTIPSLMAESSVSLQGPSSALRIQ